jgi:hypothetical protein
MNTLFRLRILALSVLLIFAIFSVSAHPDETRLEKELFNLPDVTFKKISDPEDPFLKYELRIKQPLDHKNPSGSSFEQLVIFTHRGFDAPVVMNINGYDIYRAKNEVSEMLNANELNIEYRFFGESVPATISWEFLNYEQVSADLHKINELFKGIYKGKWVSTGISRGGQTTIIYRYFYPADVDVAVPYVAPMNKSLEDNRIYTFLDTMGSDACRKKIHDFQVTMLSKEPAMLEKLKWYALARHEQFNYLGSLGKAYEYMVLEYPFSFWQVGYTPCEDVPVNKPDDENLKHLLNIVDLDFYSDKSMNDYAVHYYQNVTESGYYGYNAVPFKKYLHYIDDPEPSASFPPKTAAVKPFDAGLMNKIFAWLDKEGNNFIYVYGGRDTWSATRVTVSKQVNSKLYMVPGANHFEARVVNMPEKMQDDFIATLKTMLNYKGEVKIRP